MASARLVADPNHAAWVKAHWGADYLHHQNVFYRELLMAGLTTSRKLTGDRQWGDDRACDSYSAFRLVDAGGLPQCWARRHCHPAGRLEALESSRAAWVDQPTPPGVDGVGLRIASFRLVASGHSDDVRIIGACLPPAAPISTVTV